jgi:hypothetical protein
VAFGSEPGCTCGEATCTGDIFSRPLVAVGDCRLNDGLALLSGELAIGLSY